MDKEHVLKLITSILYDAELSDYQRLLALDALTEQVYENGYDKAASDIALKIQSCIPDKAPTVHAAQLQGAWRNAAKIALNHLGKLSNPNYPE